MPKRAIFSYLNPYCSKSFVKAAKFLIFFLLYANLFKPMMAKMLERMILWCRSVDKFRI